ncbi:hypothetical protein B0H14DRAFT_3007639 [Mycena olivaceomarginata]|nr:hypothetical protein B0H14DRAFT_3007639 [Mycena olivaceomarginata]
MQGDVSAAIFALAPHLLALPRHTRGPNPPNFHTLSRVFVRFHAHDDLGSREIVAILDRTRKYKETAARDCVRGGCSGTSV